MTLYLYALMVELWFIKTQSQDTMDINKKLALTKTQNIFDIMFGISPSLTCTVVILFIIFNS